VSDEQKQQAERLWKLACVALFLRRRACCRIRVPARRMAMGHSRDWHNMHRLCEGVDMTDYAWLAWCFQWWKDYAFYTLDSERSPVDRSEHIPPEGWVT
jgi:hypothetical protein